jgi:hypothetical protein
MSDDQDIAFQKYLEALFAHCMQRRAIVFYLGSLACEFQMVYILLSVGGSTLAFYFPELMGNL